MKKLFFIWIIELAILGLIIPKLIFAQDQGASSSETTEAVKQYVELYAGNALTNGSGGGGFSLANMIAWVVFGGVGFVAFAYGKKMSLWSPMLIGIALMVYPYFVSKTISLYAVGIILCVALYVLRE